MSTVTTIGVTGMTCANCVSHVTQELTEVDGVENVSVQLRTGAVSEVTVFSDDPLDEGALREAVDEAGYEVETVEVQTEALAAQHTEQSAEKLKARNSGCACGCGGEQTRSAGPGSGFDKTSGVYTLNVPPRD